MILRLEMLALRAMSRAIRFGLAPRSWLTLQDKVQQEEMEKAVAQAVTKPLKDVRQCPRSLRKVHSMPHEDEVVTGRRNMVSSWTGIFGKIFFAASIVFKYLSTEAQEQAYVGTTTRSFTEGTPETEVLPELFSDAFNRQYESSTTDLAPGIAQSRLKDAIPATAETFDMTDMESVETMSQADLYE
ncbi:unnamed protein product, partial [Durusdinium trenchii]